MHFLLSSALLVIAWDQSGHLPQTSGWYQVTTRTPLESVGGVENSLNYFYFSCIHQWSSGEQFKPSV